MDLFWSALAGSGHASSERTRDSPHPSRLRPFRARLVAAATSVQAGRRRGRCEDPSILTGERSSSDLLREPLRAPMLIMLFTRLSYYTGVGVQG